MNIVIAWCLGTVLILAAIGKATSNLSGRNAVVAVGEIVIGLALILQIDPVVVACLASIVTAIFLAHSILAAPSANCHCFGDRLPALSRRGQRARNGSLYVISLSYLLSTRLPSGVPGPTEVAALAAIGVVLAAAIAGLPLFFEWAVGGASPQDLAVPQ